MFANDSITRRKFNIALATLSLVAIGLSGCGWFHNYSKSMNVGAVKSSHQDARNRVNGSFFTAEEKTVALEQIDRIQTAYLARIEMKMGEKTSRAAGGWRFDAVTGDRLLVVAQVRALRDQFLPPSGLSDEEKTRGVKTCDEAICALGADKLPLDFGSTPTMRSTLHLMMDFHLSRLRDAGSAAAREMKDAAPKLPAEPKVIPKRQETVVDRDAEVRQALAILKDALADVRKKTTFVIPNGPCEIDIAAEIQESVDEFLKKLDAN